MLLIAKYIST